MIYGKIFRSMFEGSLVGAGAHVISVMAYVISHQEPDSEVGMQVRLNPKLLGPIIGEDEDRIREAIEFLCQPDPDTTTEGDDGKRLVRIGTFDYRVVNGKHYKEIGDAEELRAAYRLIKQKQREREKDKAEEANEAKKKAKDSKAYGQAHEAHLLKDPPEPTTDGKDGDK